MTDTPDAHKRPVPDFLVWKCAGCGASAVGTRKPCACPTNVGVRKGPHGEEEQTWWDAPSETADELLKDAARYERKGTLSPFEKELATALDAAIKRVARLEDALRAIAGDTYTSTGVRRMASAALAPKETNNG
jgi:hypothetical protein